LVVVLEVDARVTATTGAGGAVFKVNAGAWNMHEILIDGILVSV
jgi:hypothetical protein